MKTVKDAVEHFGGEWPWVESMCDGFIRYNVRDRLYCCGGIEDSAVHAVCTKQEFIDYVENNKVNIEWDKPIENDTGCALALTDDKGAYRKVESLLITYFVDVDGNPTDKNLPECYIVRNKVSEKYSWCHAVDELVNSLDKGEYIVTHIYDAIKSGGLPEVKRD